MVEIKWFHMCTFTDEGLGVGVSLENGIYISSDCGIIWTKISTPDGLKIAEIVAPFTIGPGEILFMASSGSAWKYCIDDETWKEIKLSVDHMMWSMFSRPPDYMAIDTAPGA